MDRTDDRVLKDRLRRKRQIRKIVGDGSTSAMPLWIWRIGDAFLVGQPNELYSQFQLALRERFAPRAIAVMNLVNGSAGYVAPREMYAAADGYQVTQSPFAAGAFELVLSAAQRGVESLLASGAGG